MGLNLCTDQRKISTSFAISDVGDDDYVKTNRTFQKNVQSLNVMNVLKRRETNQHESYHSGVHTVMKPSSSTMESAGKMHHCHISPESSDHKSSNPSIFEAGALVSSTNLPGSLGKKDNMDEIMISLVSDEWGNEAEAVINGSENLRCTMSLQNMDEKDLIPEVMQKVINSNTKTLVVEKNISKTKPALFRPTSITKWRASRITKESDAIRMQLNSLLEEVEDDSTYSEDSSTSLKSSSYSDEEEDVKEEKSRRLRSVDQ